MKKWIIGACLALAVTGTQQVQAQGLMLGIKAGVDLDKLNGQNLDGNFSGTFLVGAYTGIKFASFRVQGELLFSGGKASVGDNFEDAFSSYIKDGVTDIKEGNFKMNELSIPVTFGFNILPKFLWLYAGPQYTGIVSIKDVDGVLKSTKDVFKSGYLSGVVGADVQLPFHLNAGARYIFGISDRNNTNVDETWRGSQFQIHVGYSFL